MFQLFGLSIILGYISPFVAIISFVFAGAAHMHDYIKSRNIFLSIGIISALYFILFLINDNWLIDLFSLF